MRLLLLGGTRFVGLHITEAALARGHQVTLGWSCTRGLGYTRQNAYGFECSAQPLAWKCTCWPPNTPFP